jgi:hypothetical protein
MKATTNNPAGNALPKGITDAMMEEAVARSGYPVQTEVAITLLVRKMDVNEEWSYTDRETGKLRAIDVMAVRELADGQRPVIPRFCLLDQLPDDFPAVYGLGESAISVSVVGSGSMYVRTARALGLSEMSFLKDGPPLVSTMSRPRARTLTCPVRTSSAASSCRSSERCTKPLQ